MNKENSNIDKSNETKDKLPEDNLSLMTLEDEMLENLKQHNIPDYLISVYNWAYVKPKNIDRLDNSFIYHFILFGQGWRLMKAYLQEIKEGDRVLQVAHVYGNLVKKMAEKIGSKGNLDIIDVVPHQLERAAKKLVDFKNVDMWLQDASQPYHRQYDVVGVYFLLHEVPDPIKRKIIDNALKQIDENNAKVVFIDYHYPSPYNPVRNILKLVNIFLEPYANIMWDKEIYEFTNQAHKYHWEKTTFFGGVYQKVIVTRKPAL